MSLCVQQFCAESAWVGAHFLTAAHSAVGYIHSYGGTEMAPTFCLLPSSTGTASRSSPVLQSLGMGRRWGGDIPGAAGLTQPGHIPYCTHHIQQ